MGKRDSVWRRSGLIKSIKKLVHENSKNGNRGWLTKLGSCSMHYRFVYFKTFPVFSLPFLLHIFLSTVLSYFLRSSIYLGV